MHLLLRIFAGSLLLIACPSCKRGERGDVAEPADDAGRRSAASLNPPSVLVNNGQGAVVSTGKSYALVVPTKTGLSAGSVRVFTSATGRFADDGQLLSSYTGSLSDAPFEVLGQTIHVEAGSATSAYVALEVGARGVGIAHSPTADPKRIRAADLKFEWATPPDEAALRELIEKKR